MAKITIGIGFRRSEAHECLWREVASRLQDDWAVSISGESGLFTVTVRRPGQEHIIRTFAPNGVDDVAPLLESLRPPQ